MLDFSARHYRIDCAHYWHFASSCDLHVVSYTVGWAEKNGATVLAVRVLETQITEIICVILQSFNAICHQSSNSCRPTR